MLNKPVLAKSSNRSIKPKRHPLGSPEDWLSEDLLKQKRVCGISFDFFVNWQERTISNEIWIKRIVDSGFSRATKELINEKIIEVDGSFFLHNIAKFSDIHNLKLIYHLFKENPNWKDNDTIVKCKIDSLGRISKVKVESISDLKSNIRELSGGPLRIGSKGLIYSTSTLESYLSHTDAPWPGDLDLLLVDLSGKCLGILEFKKHNLTTPINEQRLSNYYPRPDGRKYDRLALFRDFIDPNLPLIVIYYPTKPHFQSIKLEKISGPSGNLYSSNEMIIDIPTNNTSKENLINSILSL